MANPGSRLKARNSAPIPINRIATYVEPRLVLRINPSQGKIQKFTAETQRKRRRNFKEKRKRESSPNLCS
jgi:hypothetical protein